MNDERLAIRIEKLLGNIRACLYYRVSPAARESAQRDLLRLRRIIDKLLMPEGYDMVGVESALIPIKAIIESKGEQDDE